MGAAVSRSNEGLILIVLGVVIGVFSRYSSSAQVSLLKAVWGTDLTERGKQVVMWIYLVVAGGLVLFGAYLALSS